MDKLLARAGNDALNSNPTVADIDIGVGASDFLWMVFSVMAATTIGVGVWSSRVPQGQRTFHYLSMMITTTASVAYFCLASDLGATPIKVEFVRGSYLNPLPTRSIWYVRYVDWTITTPLLLLELLLVSGLPLSDIIITIFMDLVMIVTGLVGALVSSQYKWGLWTFGCFAMFYVFWQLLWPGRASSKALGPEANKSYLYSTLLLSSLWFIYPLVWALCDGGNVISPTGEMVWYGILDLLAKPVFTIFHLYSMRNVDYSALGLTSGKYSAYATASPLRGDVPHNRNTATSAHTNEGTLHDHHAEATGSGTKTTI